MKNQQSIIRNLRLALENETSHPVQLIETHISWVLVASDFAYKFKKAVHLDFLNFSTLEARRFYCLEELRLNRRLAPAMYLEVLAVTGTPDQPVIAGSGAPIEYAVKMQAFEQQALWSFRIDHGLITPGEIDALAEKIAGFHLGLSPASEPSPWSTPEALEKIGSDNFAAFAALGEVEAQRQLAELSTWQTAHQAALAEIFKNRKRLGFIRECHGDLHSNNILSWNDRVQIFDCIEFDPGLRWIDVLNEVAFIVMDLQFRQRPELAARLLNRYLQQTGDYEGLAVLRYYLIQRALVRGKVALLRARQLSADNREAAECKMQARRYLALAARSARPKTRAILITHGYSGSGKSVFSRHLVELLGAVQIRSDVERKRMFGIAATAHAGAAPGTGIYHAGATDATYRRLLVLAESIVGAGMPVIVDAAFLKIEERTWFGALARKFGVPFFIFDLRAAEATLRARILARQAHGKDVSDAGLDVLAQQLKTAEPLSDSELRQTVVIENEAGVDLEAVRKLCGPVIAALRE